MDKNEKTVTVVLAVAGTLIVLVLFGLFISVQSLTGNPPGALVKSVLLTEMLLTVPQTFASRQKSRAVEGSLARARANSTLRTVVLSRLFFFIVLTVITFRQQDFFLLAVAVWGTAGILYGLRRDDDWPKLRRQVKKIARSLGTSLRPVAAGSSS